MGKRGYMFFFVFGLCPIFLGGMILYQRWNFGDDSAFLGGMIVLFGMAVSAVGLLVRFDAHR